MRKGGRGLRAKAAEPGAAGAGRMPMSIRRRLVDGQRIVNKYAINRVTLAVAGGAHSPFSIVRHVGRRTGKAYATPVIACAVPGGLVIAFTYGLNVDWYRNIAARGECTVRRNGKELACARPRLIDGRAALPAFPLLLRLILRIVGTSQFLRLDTEGKA